MSEVMLEMRNVTKRFPGVVALKDVSITVNKGEVMAICGENGAGKSTLMKVLSGSYNAKEYEGEIFIDGQKQVFTCVHDAERCGIEMAYQETNMIMIGTVAENLYVGNLPGNKVFVDWKKLYSDTEKKLKRMGLNFSPKTIVGTLSSGQMQMLAILRAVIKKPKIFVLDEPTSSLSDKETDTLFELIKELKNQGVSIIFITHKLDEVFRIADRVTVMRDGSFVFVDKTENVSNNMLIEHMVGRKLENQYPKTKAPIGDEVLRVENLTVPHPTLKGKNIVENLSFSLRGGEILGFGGLVGAGRSESLAAVFGQTTNGVKKTIYVDGKEVSIHNPNDAKKHGMGFLTEERRKSGFVPVFSVCHNLTLCIIDHLPKGKFIIKKKEEQLAKGIYDRLRIKSPSLYTQIVNLSGGNQQKVVLGKWLLDKPHVLIMDEPTKGIDVGAKVEIYNIMCELAAQGIGIILISSDMTELIAMSDRCLVLSNGRITGELTGDEITQENVMRAAIAE